MRAPLFAAAAVVGSSLMASHADASSDLRRLEAAGLRAYVDRAALTTAAPVHVAASSSSNDGDSEAAPGNVTAVNVTQIHLALGTNPTSATVSWTCEAPAQVLFGQSATALHSPPVRPFVSANYTMVSVPRNTSSFEARLARRASMRLTRPGRSGC